MSNKNYQPPKASVINHMFLFFVLSAVLWAGFNGRMKEVSQASVESAQAAVALVFKMLGVMVFWLGLMRVLEVGGLMRQISRLLKPLMCRLFPDVPAEHPAMSAMILNISANMLGLGNAATPFGLKAMAELNKLNPLKQTASNAMCLFLAINTSSVTLLPLGAISIMAAAGTKAPAAIFIPTLFATCSSTLIAVLAAMFLAKRDKSYLLELASIDQQVESDSSDKANIVQDESDSSHLLVPPSPYHRYLALILSTLFLLTFVYRVFSAPSTWIFLKEEVLTYWLIPGLIFFMLLYGLARGVKTYEALCEGGKQGFEMVIKIIPFLVAILVAIGVFRASGAMDFLVAIFSPLTNLIGMPAEVLPMALMRPLSGSGAMGIMSSIVENAPNSYSAFLAATINGCTETTFYVLAVYFGSVGITRIRYALLVGILADIAGVLASCLACSVLW